MSDKLTVLLVMSIRVFETGELVLYKHIRYLGLLHLSDLPLGINPDHKNRGY
jgi:hypothetical protein